MKSKWFVALVLIVAITLTAYATGSQETPETSVAGPEIEVMVYPKTSFPNEVDMNDNMVINRMREETGANLVWSLQPTESNAERLAVMFASGDAADIIELDDKVEVARYATQGVLAPLNEALEEHGQYLLEAIPSKDWSAVTSEGKIYGIPRPANYVTSPLAMVIRKDWLDRYGLDVPRTPDEFYEVMRVFKEEDPAGDGNTVPLAAGQVMQRMQGLAAAFGVVVPYAQRDGEVVYTYVEPEAREFLSFARKLYAEGLINRDYPVITSTDPLDDLFASGYAGMTTLYWWDAMWLFPAVQENDPEAELLFIPPAINDDGLTGLAARPPTESNLAFAASSENLDLAVKFVNDLAENENLQYFISYGQEGVHHTVGDDGVITPTDKIEELAYAANYVIWDTYDNFMNRVRYRGFYPYYSAMEAFDVVHNVYNYVPPLSEVDEVAGELEDIRVEHWVKIISGATPLEEGWEDYVSAWENAGGPQALAAIQAAYEM